MTAARRAIPIGLTLAVVAALALYLFRQREYIAERASLDPWLCLAVAALVPATLGLRAVANRVLFGRLGVDTSIADWFRVVTVTTFTNYLPLSAGLVAKGVYLNRVHDLPYRTYAAGQVGYLLIVLATNGAVGLATLAFALPAGLFGPVGAGFVLLMAPVAFLYLPGEWAQRLGGRWLPSEAAPGVRRALPGVACLQVGMLVATAAGLALCFRMTGGPVSFAACLVYAAAVVLSRLITLTPGALGIREFLVGTLAWLTGFELRDAVIAATLSRVIEIVVVFALGALFTFRLAGRVAASYEDG